MIMFNLNKLNYEVIIMAKKSSTTFKKQKKTKKVNNHAEISQELNYEEALKKIKYQDNKINE